MSLNIRQQGWFVVFKETHTRRRQHLFSGSAYFFFFCHPSMRRRKDLGKNKTVSRASRWAANTLLFPPTSYHQGRKREKNICVPTTQRMFFLLFPTLFVSAYDYCPQSELQQYSLLLGSDSSVFAKQTWHIEQERIVDSAEKRGSEEIETEWEDRKKAITGETYHVKEKGRFSLLFQFNSTDTGSTI